MSARKASSALRRGAAWMMLARHRMQRLGFDARAAIGRDVALGHPGPFVEQARGLENGAKSTSRALAAERLESLHRVVEQTRVLRVAEELELRRARHAEAEAGAAPQPRAPRAARRATRDRAASKPRGYACSTRAASSAVSAKIDTQSSERQAGTTPRMLRHRSVGLSRRGC